MKIKILLAFIVSFFSLNNETLAQEIAEFYNHYTAIPGQPETPIISVFEDSDGFIWFTSMSGLYRYDGYNLMHYTQDPLDTTTLSDNLIRSVVFEDKKKGLWLSSLSNTIDRFDKVTGKVTRFKPETYDLEGKLIAGIKEGCQDSNGNILGISVFGSFIFYDHLQGSIHHHLFYPDNPDSSINSVNTIIKDRCGKIWIGTKAGILIYNEKKRTYKRFRPDSTSSFFLDSLSVYSILEDQAGIIWFGTGSGLIKYTPASGQLTQYKDSLTPGNQYYGKVYENYPDQGKSLWLRKYNGLSLFYKASETFRFFPINPEDPKYKYWHLVYTELMDKNGNLWLASDNHGLIKISPREPAFKSFKIQYVPESPYNYMGASFYKEEDGTLWVGTGYGGLFKYDNNMKLLDHFRPDQGTENAPNAHFIFSLLKDKENLWIGFAGNGLGKLNTKTGSYQRILNYDDRGMAPMLRVVDIFKDSYGIIWFLSTKGLYFTDTNIPGSIVKDYPCPEKGNISLMSVYEDSKGNVWFTGPQFGHYLLKKENRKDSLLIRLKHVPNVPGSLPTNQVSCICQDTVENYWVGTAVGIYQFIPEDSSFKAFDHERSKDYLTVSWMQRDPEGNIWGLSEQGLFRFNPRAEQDNVFRTITTFDGMPFEKVYPYKLYIDGDGIIYCGARRGSGNGFFTLNPKLLSDNKHIPPVYLTGFKVRNETFKLDSTITYIKEINLKHDQNYFSFEFSALDFVNPQQNQYAYMLDGYDEDWILCGNRHFANYTGVTPGTYNFLVKGSNNDGLWNETGTSVKLIISPPFWKTWWAFMIYGIIFISLLIAWRRYDLKRHRLKKALEIEQVEAEKLKELDKLKSQFFANISHEFRTPLTLIMGPLEKFRKKVIDQADLLDLNIMQRNAWRLQTLINQLLSLSKIESGKMKLQAWEEDIVSLSRGYVQSFESLAQQQHIRLTFHSTLDYLPVYIDRDKIEKILYNLLSNAIKYTLKGGKVEVGLTRSEKMLHITVADTGHGIAEEQLEHIFDRFYSSASSAYQEGTGVGLALVKELVTLHHGSISVESKVGKGTTFTVKLPLGKNHLKETEIISSPEDMISPFTLNLHERENAGDAMSTDLVEENHSLSESGPVMLIIEDNADLRLYIRGYFEDKFQIVTAENGTFGYEKAIGAIPDIIISDVMMPGMDGFELSRKLKSNELTSHIPLILLTARASSESKMEGLETGADDFITKPFYPQELQVRVHNLIEQRKRLAKYYRNNIDNPEIFSILSTPTSGISDFDRKFLEKAINTILDNLADADFGVEKYSDKMAMSRTHLHRKLKSLLSLSPSDLIRLIRLKKAAELLKQQAGNVSQIAYEVGFNNLSYFAKCFQEQFGCLPSEYK